MIANRDDALKTDLELAFADDGGIDLNWSGTEMATLDGTKNLVQALKLRLLVYRGELGGTGHPRYGSRIREMIGRPLTRANLDLLRRHVRNAIHADPRVRKIHRVSVTPRMGEPGAVDVYVKLLATTEEELTLAVGLDLIE